MNKRQFLKTSGALITGGLLSGVDARAGDSSSQTNWSGNYRYSTDRVLTPNSSEEVPEMVRGCRKLRAVGTRHSFNGIADSREAQISLRNLNGMQLDEKAGTVAIGAGVTYGKLAPFLDSKRFALHNLASLPHISVAGAISTGTHGSGSRNGNLSTQVRALDIITADGSTRVVDVDRAGEQFHGAVVGLGALGVVTKIVLNVVPSYQVSQVVYENLPLTRLRDHLDDVFSSGYSVSLFTDWQNHRATQAWVKSRVGESGTLNPATEFFGATRATRKLHPLAGHSAENCTEQMGVPGPWYERLPHFRMNFTPSSGNELQSEYFVPRNRGYEAILAVEGLRDQITPHLLISELRTVAADELWMSPCYQRESMAIHFTWKPDWPSVRTVLPLIEEKLAPFGARPHWAKLYVFDGVNLQNLYPKGHEFTALLKRFDSGLKFRNEYIETHLLG